MADLSHLAWPYKLGVDVDQDTPAEIRASLAVIACTPRGWRDDNPDFGVTTPLFTQRPVDTARLATELQRAEPRSSPTAREITDITDQVTGLLVNPDGALAA